MKNYFYPVFFLLLFCSIAIGQPAADIVLESIVTPEYETYLWDQAAQCDLILETPAADSVNERLRQTCRYSYGLNSRG